MPESPTAVPGAPSADRYFGADGARLRYRDEGEGPPVVLVHGWTLDLEMWDPQIAAFRSAFRLVRLDRRGHGHSGGVPAPGHDALDLAALCRHLGLARVALLGMSQGARGVLGFAAAEPARVSCLVLDGVPDFDVDPGSEDEVPIAHYRALARSAGIDAFRRAWAAHPLMRLRTTDPHRRALLETMIHRYPARDLLRDLPQKSVSPEPAAAGSLFDSLRVPALLINGACDLPKRLEAAARLRRRLPAAEHALVPDAGHLPNLDNPGHYEALCRAFLTRHATVATSS
jgi:pimeloyl-ACP methyl ester carboxylesterase